MSTLFDLAQRLAGLFKQSPWAVVANLITVYKALGGGWEVWTPIEKAAPRTVAAEGS